MANISLLSRLVNGIQRQVDLSSNTLVVSDLQINGINLRSTTNGSEGTRAIGDFNSYSNFTGGSTLKQTLSGIDTAIGAASASGANKTLSNLTSPTAINQDLLPAANVTQHIGANGSNWLQVWTKEILYSGQIDFRLDTGLLYNSTGAHVADFANLALNDNSSVKSVDWAGRLLADTAGTTQLSWSTAGVSVATALLMGGAINMSSFGINNLATPVNPGDAVTKAYVDNFINATSWKTAVLVATTANITLSGEQTIDGVTTSASRVLVKNQSTASQNGIYVSASGAWTRSSDMNLWSEVPAAAVFVESGTVNADLGFVCTSQPGGTLGTTAINFVQFSSAGAYSADGVTLTLTSGVFAIKNAGVTETQLASTIFAASSALAGGAGTKIAVQVDNSSIFINGSNQLAVKAAGITAAMLGAVADGVTLDQSGAGSTLEIKNAGVSAAKLATGVADQVTITGGAGTALSVAQAPVVGSSEVAGTALSATTLYALRYMVAADSGFVAGRVTPADNNAASSDLFHAIGLAYPASAVSVAGAVSVVEEGVINVPSHGFTVGLPLFLGSSGAVTQTPPSTTNLAVVKLGMVKDANNIRVQIQIMGVN